MIPTQETLLGFITARLYVVEADLPQSSNLLAVRQSEALRRLLLSGS